MTVSIRDATGADADAIAEVHVASWRWAYAGIVPDQVLDGISVEARRQMWRGWFETGEDRASVLVAVEDARVMGFSGVGPSRDDDAPPSTCEVRTLYLREAAAGRGIGRDLFDEATARMRALGFRRATLWVLRDSARARRFYDAAGWSWDGTTSAHPFGDVTRPIVRYVLDL